MADVALDQPADVEALPEDLQFYGGPFVSIVPLLIFLACCGALLYLNALTETAMLLGGMAGITVGLVLARNRAAYADASFSLMADPVVMVAIVCWLWAGAFAGILRASGLVEGITWLAWNLGLTGGAFTAVAFLGASVFAVSVGTGIGTILGFTSVIYPAGVLLGAEPAALMGAILSGAAFGDNLAPVSDTTIVSAATQQVDVGGVVRSRLRYVLIAGGIALGLYLILGGTATGLDAEEAAAIAEANARPQGLIMLASAVVLFALAMDGQPFLVAISASIVSAIVIGLASGVTPLETLFSVDEDGTPGGALIAGAGGMINLCILTLIVATNIGVFRASGGHTIIMRALHQSVARGIRGAELTIVGVVTAINLMVPVNTIAMITIGPLVNDFRKQFGINGYRAANLLDTVSCSFPYALPYAAPIVSALAAQQAVVALYPDIPQTGWLEIAGNYYYGWLLLPLMIVAAITGFGRGTVEEIKDHSFEDAA